MQLLHHRITLREDDGASVCSRCGLIDPGDDDACIPVKLEPAESGNSEKKAAA
jgi:hypothetical protein